MYNMYNGCLSESTEFQWNTVDGSSGHSQSTTEQAGVLIAPRGHTLH